MGVDGLIVAVVGVVVGAVVVLIGYRVGRESAGGTVGESLARQPEQKAVRRRHPLRAAWLAPEQGLDEEETIPTVEERR